jgi:hypothetical protein
MTVSLTLGNLKTREKRVYLGANGPQGKRLTRLDECWTVVDVSPIWTRGTRDLFDDNPAVNVEQSPPRLKY